MNLEVRANDFGRARVVGTVITEEFLTGDGARGELPCELVELRVDGFAEFPGWIEAGQAMERRGMPVFATVRLSREGGHWKRPDAERLPLLLQGLENLSGVDVELASELAEGLCAKARELGKFCIVSHHDFARTPGQAELEGIIERGRRIGTVVKIAAMIESPEDRERLRALLRRDWGVPLCVIGMGPLGQETRVEFPREGSCLAYGYLDKAGAPGQFSARELRSKIFG